MENNNNKKYVESIDKPMPNPELDLLKKDKKITGQKYCCLSFVEPPINTYEKKESFLMNEFFLQYLKQFTKVLLKKISEDNNLNYDDLLIKYSLKKNVEDDKTNFTDEKWNKTKKIHKKEINNHFFKSEFEDFLVEFIKYKNYYAKELANKLKNQFPNEGFIGGVKFRGAFSTLNKARNYSNKLSKLDKDVNIYVCESGAWVPFNPSNTNIKHTKTSEKQLNEMMWKHKKNVMHRKMFFNERKEEEKNKILSEDCKKNIESEKDHNIKKNNSFDDLNDLEFSEQRKRINNILNHAFQNK